MVRRHRIKLLRFLTAYLGNGTDAEDLVQETFTRAYRSLDRYDPNQSFSTWLFTIGRRLSANEKRRQARLRKRETEWFAETEQSEQSLGFEEGSIWAAAKDILSEGAYVSVWLHYGEGKAVKEIARIMGKTVTGVKVTLFRARRALAAGLDPKLVSESLDR